MSSASLSAGQPKAGTIMEHIGRIMTRTNSSAGGTVASSSAKPNGQTPGPDTVSVPAAGARVLSPRLGRRQADYGRVVPCGCAAAAAAPPYAYSNLGALSAYTF